MNKTIKISGHTREYIFNVYPIDHKFFKIKDWGAIYIYLYNDKLIYCGKDSNFPNRLNYHKCKDKNIIEQSNYIAVCFLDPQEFSLEEVESDILMENLFEINIHHNLK